MLLALVLVLEEVKRFVLKMMPNVTKERVAAIVAPCIIMKIVPALNALILPRPPHYLQLWGPYASSWLSLCRQFQVRSSRNQVSVHECLVIQPTSTYSFSVKYFVISSNFLQKMFSVKASRLQPSPPKPLILKILFFLRLADF